MSNWQLYKDPGTNGIMDHALSRPPRVGPGRYEVEGWMIHGFTDEAQVQAK